jgi:hypothetical protein
MLVEFTMCFYFVERFVVAAVGMWFPCVNCLGAAGLRSRSSRGKVVGVGLASFPHYSYGRLRREV